MHVDMFQRRRRSSGREFQQGQRPPRGRGRASEATSPGLGQKFVGELASPLLPAGQGRATRANEP